jgi:hypothetical protein
VSGQIGPFWAILKLPKRSQSMPLGCFMFSWAKQIRKYIFPVLGSVWTKKLNKIKLIIGVNYIQTRKDKMMVL